MSETTLATKTEEGAMQMTTTEITPYQVQSIYRLQVSHYWEAFRNAESIGRKYYSSEDLGKLAEQMMAKGHLSDALNTYALAAHCWRETLREYEEMDNKTRAEDARKAFSGLLIQWVKAWHKSDLSLEELHDTVLPLYDEYIDLLRKRVAYFKEDANDVVEYARLVHVLAEALVVLGEVHRECDPTDRTALTLCQEGAQLLEDIAAEGVSVDSDLLAQVQAKLTEIETAFKA